MSCSKVATLVLCVGKRFSQLAQHNIHGRGRVNLCIADCEQLRAIDKRLNTKSVPAMDFSALHSRFDCILPPALPGSAVPIADEVLASEMSCS